jgi:hypothetical protein
MASTLSADWPSIRDVARECDVSSVYVLALVHSGRLHGVRTRLGWLISPDSARAYASERAARRARRRN